MPFISIPSHLLIYQSLSSACTIKRSRRNITWFNTHAQFLKDSVGKVSILFTGKGKKKDQRFAPLPKRFGLWDEDSFKIDVTICKKCGGRIEQIAVIKDRVVAKAILQSLKETSIFNPLKLVRERGPPEQASCNVTKVIGACSRWAGHRLP